METPRQNPAAAPLLADDYIDPTTRAELVGRRRHLGNLALKFYRRGGTWGDLGRFLKGFFDGHERFKGKGFHIQDCRHTSGRHGRIIQDGLRAGNPVFADIKFRRPCMGFGKGDFNTTPGYIVHDLCNRAADYLSSIGKGRLLEQHDLDFEPGSDCSGSSVNTDSEDDDEEEFDDLDDPRQYIPDFPRIGTYLTNVDPRVTKHEVFMLHEEALQDGLHQAEAAVDGIVPERQTLEPVAVARDLSQATVSEISGLSSQTHSLNRDPSTPRQITKIRIATLAYLCKFWNDPESLRREFQRLRRDPTMCVLHLCGCGLQRIATIDHYGENVHGESYSGCTERSHLILGTAELNRRHAFFHKMMRISQAQDYAALVDITQRAEGGEGIF